ncbi:MAG: MBL fold metallo-hydrolase [Gammaproteobacteria bacterium]|jgi:glyoxylase-like metal-dependent hydrolase (beta-lactamase superfamily II)
MLQWKIGDTTITQLLEMSDSSGSIPVLPDATPENLGQIDWLKPHFVSPEGNLILNIQMLIIETPTRKMVVDTCIGNDKNLNMDGWANLQLPFLDDLKQLGHDPDSIDTVICTHLHVDHVGWNTRRVGDKWVPTFPNARYLMVDREFEFWRDLEEDPFGDVFGESVAPVFDAGLADLVKSDHTVGDGVWFESTPGHTPGHVSVHIESQGEHAIISGDMMHHPCQIARPEWVTPFDADNEAAFATRKAFLERYADEPVLVFGTHFANPVAGRIVRDGKTYRFDV